MIDTHSSDDEIRKYLTTPPNKAETQQVSQGATNEANAHPDNVQAVTGNEAVAHTAQASKHEDLRLIFAELSRNYDKDEAIAPPERVGIFVRDYVNILAGKSGMFKSWQIVRWMRDLSIGGEVFGGVVHNEPPRKCLLIAGELPKCEMERRCRLLEMGEGIERNYNNFIIVDQKQSEAKNISLMLDDKNGKRNIEALIDYHSPDAVIFDSFISLFNGDESKSKDVNPVMAFLERLAVKSHIAPILVHHIRKRLSREQMLPIDQDDVIGSSSFLRKGGFLFTVEPSPDDPQTIYVKNPKAWLKKIHPFTYKLDDGIYGGVRMHINPNAEDKRELPTSNKKEAPSDAEIQRKEIIAFLKGKGSHQATTQEIRDILGIQKNEVTENNTLIQTLKRMTNNREIIKPNNKRGVYALPEPESMQEETESEQPDNEEPTLDLEEE